MVQKSEKPDADADGSQTAPLAGAVRESAQQTWLAGLGAFSKAQEEGGKVFENLVKEGLTIQRKSHIQNDALPLASQRRPIQRPLWLVGFGIYIVTNILGTIFQLDALPIVILEPLGAVSLIYNALLARLILGDRFGARMVGGTTLVAAGAVLIAVFGVVEEAEHSIEELLSLWGRPAFLAFFWVVIGLTLIVLGVVSLALRMAVDFG